MGSRSTTVELPPHVDAAASTGAPTQNHHKKSDDPKKDGPRQDYVHQILRRTVTLSQPCNSTSPTPSTQSTATARRRYSKPSRTTAMTALLNTDVVRHLAVFEGFLAERELMGIDMDYESLLNPASGEDQRPSVTAPVHDKEDSVVREGSDVQCVACCAQLPGQEKSRHVREAIWPCRSCNSAYCITCVRGMFLTACKDSTRMPPRCCTQIHLHHIKAHLTVEEITEYKSKHEEWSTEKPFYCPVPSCSVFIPERLLPQSTRVEDRRKTDSGIGTPSSPKFQCPRCEASICTDCRQLSHPDSLCATLDLGVDPATAVLLRAWGYKRCPKCNQGLKRMYGCNHMECRCGAHFCWGCLRGRDECDGSCSDDDDDDDEGFDSDPDTAEVTIGSEHEALFEALRATAGVIETTKADGTIEAQIDHTLETAATSEPALRLRNLDGGGSRYWEQRDLDLGAEPTDDIQDRAWDCHHSFEPYTISLTQAISGSVSNHGMECVKCWCEVRPDIQIPPESATVLETRQSPRSPPRRGRGGRRGRGRGTVARLRPAPYVPPRGLTRFDATIGTASHLTAPLSSNEPTPEGRRFDLMEDVRKESMSESMTDPSTKAPASAAAAPTIFSNLCSTHSIAQECVSCSLLVCKNCADSILAQRETERDMLAAGTAVATMEVAEAQMSLQEEEEQQRSDHDEQPPPSLFD